MAKHRYERTPMPRRYIVNYYKWFWYCKARPALRRVVRTLISNLKNVINNIKLGNKSTK